MTVRRANGSPLPTAPSEPKLSPDASATYYENVPVDRFGTTEVKTFAGASHLVPDLHYPTAEGLGLRLVGASGKCKALDEVLRTASGLAPGEPIYAFTSHLKPREFQGTWQHLATKTLKPDRGVAHMGAYLGGGTETSAPAYYHHNQLTLAGAPVNMHVVSLQGVPQAVLNKTLRMVDDVLNDGVVFPENYWEDDYIAVDLRTTLMFYREWLLGEPELRDNPRFATYCSEHKIMVLNTALNLPHHRAAFVDVFGPDEGAKVWDAFTAHFAAQHGRPFTTDDETHFEPLWKRDGISPERLRPPSVSAWLAWDAAQGRGEPAPLGGFRPLAPFRAMAFRAEREADLIRDFVDTYCRFEDAGGLTAATALLSFCEPTCTRTGITREKFLSLAMPIVQKLLSAEARVQCTQRGWLARAARQLRAELPAALATEAVVMQSLELAAATLREGHRTPLTRTEAGTGLRRACLRDFVRARSMRVFGDDRTVNYAPPAVLHRIEMGQHAAHAGVTFSTVCTAIDQREIR